MILLYFNFEFDAVKDLIIIIYFIHLIKVVLWSDFDSIYSDSILCLVFLLLEHMLKVI